VAVTVLSAEAKLFALLYRASVVGPVAVLRLPRCSEVAWILSPEVGAKVNVKNAEDDVENVPVGAIPTEKLSAPDAPA
jgi:hypothetical protein